MKEPLLSKEAIAMIHDRVKDHKGRMYGSFYFADLKGGWVYKVYHEYITQEEISEEPAYVKLVFPDETEIVMRPFTKTALKEAFEKSREAAMMRFEWKKKSPHGSKYLYVFKVGNEYFDLQESYAKIFIKNFDLECCAPRSAPR